MATLDSVPAAANAAAQARPGKYLAFHVGPEQFAVAIMKVREIIGVQEITAVPQSPAHIKGVINLRGKVIPIADLRRKFGFPEIEYTDRTCIIVVHADGQSGPQLMGIVVDGVSEVLNLTAADVEGAPDYGGGAGSPYVLGLAKVKGKIQVLLDIDQVLAFKELAQPDSEPVKETQ